jgi:hypothetical protein
MLGKVCEKWQKGRLIMKENRSNKVINRIIPTRRLAVNGRRFFGMTP